MLQHSRRALSNIVTRTEVPVSDEEIHVDLVNLFVSASVDLFAIYYSSYAALRIWRAIEAYDAGNVGQPNKSCKLSKKGKFLIFGAVALYLALGPGMIYSAAINSETLNRWIIGIATAIFATFGFCAPLLSVFTDIEVHRIAGRKGIFPVIRSIKEHKRRACRIISLSAVLGVCTAVFPHRSLLTFATGGVVFTLISRPAMISPPGWLSVRGIVMALYAFLFLIVTLTEAVVFAALKSEEETGEESMIIPVAEKIYPFSRLTVHIMNAYIGALIAMILRYEYTLSPNYAPLDNDDAMVHGASDEKLVKSDASPEVVATETTGSSVPVSRTFPCFSAPLFHITLLCYFLLHVPALILVHPRFQYLWADKTRSDAQRLLFLLIVETPPQVYLTLFIPSVIGLAALVRKDGSAMWRYAERWVQPVAKKSDDVEGGDDNNAANEAAPLLA